MIKAPTYTLFDAKEADLKSMLPTMPPGSRYLIGAVNK